jgi:hypothetical protein
MNSGPQTQQFPQAQPGQAMMYPQMAQNYMGQPNSQPTGLFDAQTLLASFMDIARQQGFQMPLGVPQHVPSNISQQMFQAQHFPNNVMPQSDQGQSISTSFPNSFANGNGLSGPSSAITYPPSPEVCGPSIHRRSSPLSTPSPPASPKLSKGKEKTSTPRQNSFKRKRSEISDKSSEEDIFATPPPRHSMTKTPHVLSPRKLGEIFRSDSGESMLFFVQVDLMGRHGVVQNIKVRLLWSLCYAGAYHLIREMAGKWSAASMTQVTWC